jgi:hypothetical protein
MNLAEEKNMGYFKFSQVHVLLSGFPELTLVKNFPQFQAVMVQVSQAADP